MPILFAVGQHGALEATRARLGCGEHVMAFLDDLHSEQTRTFGGCAHCCGWRALDQRQIHLHHGNAQVWNRGVEPSGMPELTRAARAVKPDAVVWRGDPGLPQSQQGLKVLGIPVGQSVFLSTDPVSERPAGCFPPPLDVRVDQNQLLVAGSAA